MEIRKKIDYCQSCNTYCEHNYGVENYDPSVLDLDNYLKYKDIYVYECPKCGHVSIDLARKEDVEPYTNAEDSDQLVDEFLFHKKYLYLEGTDLDFVEPHTRSVPANLYDCYALLLNETDNQELFVRSLNMAIELKEMIVQKYIDSINEDGDEEDQELFEEFNELMQDNIHYNRELIVDRIENFPYKSVFYKLIQVENLIKLDKLELAKEKLKKLNSKYKLSTDLNEYFEKLFIRG